MQSKPFNRVCFLFGLLLGCYFNTGAQENRAQYPRLLTNSYFSVNVGYIGYHFSQRQLEPGYTASSVRVPHAGLSIQLGHQFNNFIAAEISYMRPFAFVEYRNVNGVSNYEVGMNVAALTIKPMLPISKEISINAELGVAVVTRGGFIVGNAAGVKDEMYATVSLGAGIEYLINKNWSLNLAGGWSPKHEKASQPATIFLMPGFKYNMRKLSADKVANSLYDFPRQVWQLGLTTNAIGYGANNFFSKDAHIFWAGGAQVKTGVSLNYCRNVFHTRKTFALDVGVGAAYWISRKSKQAFVTVSAYPILRFIFYRSGMADVYFNYSLAGPSFISKTLIDDNNTGEAFTFQDFMGLGLFSGKKKQINAEFRIAHYSNGNIYPQNIGVMIPLTLVVGYAFK